jgi:hypothetical protein
MLSLTTRSSAETAVKMNRGTKSGELLHNELHNPIGRRRVAEIVRKIITVRWPRG